MKKLYKMWFKVITIVVFSALNIACSSINGSTKAYSIEKQMPLPSTLKETSGLYCPIDNTIYTVNDSGNSPIIYQLDENANLLSETKVDAQNIDWEAITGDEQYFYVGDIGNNAGKRKLVNIIRVAKNGADTHKIEVSYANNNIENNEYIKHDFDAEALVSVNEHLYLFSKSWQTKKLHVYRVNNETNKQNLSPIASIEGFPGVVTGVDYNKQSSEFVFVGYSFNSVGIFSPFLAKVTTDYEIMSIIPLQGFHQVEGVCISPNGDVWISQESSFFSGSQLVKLKLY